MRIIKNRLFDYLGHYLLPELAAIAAFLAFSFHPGALGDLMRICSALVLLNLIIRNYRLNVPGYLPVYVIVGFILLLAMNFFAPADQVHRRSFSYFIAFPGMALAIYYLILTKTDSQPPFSLKVYATLFSAAVIIQFLIAQFGDGRQAHGIYSNLHHLGLFASLLIPVIAYLTYIVGKTWWRWPLIIAGLLSFYLLFSSTSEVSWFALFASSILAIVIFFKGWHKLYAALGVLVFSVLGGVFFGLSRIIGNIAELISQIHEERRWVIWSDTLTMLKDNSLLDWVVGHGIGSFRYFFQDYSTYITPRQKIFQTSFPHNGFLQILFENGIIGFLVIFGGLFLLLVALIKAYHVFSDKAYRLFTVAVFAIFWIDIIHWILTESLYRKYISFTLSVIMGMMMALIAISKQLDDSRKS